MLRVSSGAALLPLLLSGLFSTSCGSSSSGIDDCTDGCGGAAVDSGDGASTGGAATGGGAGASNQDCSSVPSVVTDTPGLVLDTNGDAGISVSFHGNHVGFDANGTKRIVIESTGALSNFQLVRSEDQVPVLERPLTSVGAFSAWGSSKTHFIAEFDDYRTAGSYVVRVNAVNSAPFRIEKDLLFSETFDDLLQYFRASRADDADVWSADASVVKYGSTETHDVRGGWYDASGDISKYLSHLSYANFLNPQQIPLVAWSLAWVAEHAADAVTTAGAMNDLQDEAAYGADYLVRVLDDAGYFYATVFDGWTGDLGARRICAFTGSDGVENANYQAAFREGGGMAIAALARISKLGRSGTFTSADYLAAAKKGFAHLLTAGSGYADDGKQNIIDDYAALLAASELYAASSDAAYLTEARSRASSLSSRLSQAGYFIADGGSRPFWHGSDAGLPVVALVRYTEIETDDAQRGAALDAIERHLEYLVEVSQNVTNPYQYARQHVNVGATVQASFFLPHDNETGYWWQGESARLASLATALRMGRRALFDAGHCQLLEVDGADAYPTAQLDWILGNNPLDISFMNGVGRNNPPGYCSDKAQNGSHVGGISNGITGSANDGSGFQWMANIPDQCWQEWRWVEQWLPHSAWFMLALASDLEP